VRDPPLFDRSPCGSKRFTPDLVRLAEEEMPQITFEENAGSFTVFIDGQPIDSARLADGSYYVGVFPHQNFPTPADVLQILTQTYGVLWSDQPGEM
jgi:hypothetical protein